MTRIAINESSTQQDDTSLGRALELRGPGVIEVMRVTRLVRKAKDVLHFSGAPASSQSRVRELQVSFVQGEAPAPGFDAVSGLLRLFYGEHERLEVERTLMSKRGRYCYFWHSRDGVSRRAWLLTSP